MERSEESSDFNESDSFPEAASTPSSSSLFSSPFSSSEGDELSEAADPCRRLLLPWCLDFSDDLLSTFLLLLFLLDREEVVDVFVVAVVVVVAAEIFVLFFLISSMVISESVFNSAGIISEHVAWFTFSCLDANFSPFRHKALTMLGCSLNSM
jgi:hypothetical protein